MSACHAPLRLRLPATSANLGPGFDAAALALALHLEIDAQAADKFAIAAEGRHPELCSALEANLLVDSYRALWTAHCSGPVQPLALQIRNGIPMGMGCGSSAAARLAAVALVSHFGALGWDRNRMLAEGAALEHHPDNVAACALGGFTVSGYGAPVGIPDLGALDVESSASKAAGAVRPVLAVSLPPAPGWYALLVLPALGLATTISRAVLPGRCERTVVVGNLQNLALLVAAFSRGDAALLASGTRDGLHQPYRSEMCPLLGRLLPLAGKDDILSVTLSGAGSGVLLLLRSEAALPRATELVVAKALGSGREKPLSIAELLPCPLELMPAKLSA